MAPDKVTVMILNVDLKCSCCYKKVKKLLCKFPQIRDQVFDHDKNKVRITVVCCNPDKLRDTLCCKGGKAIQSIEIVEDKPKTKKKPEDNHKPPQGRSGGPCYPVPIQACCQECSQGRSGGPCYDFGYNYGRPVPPPPCPCYDGYGYQYARNRPCYVTRCDCFSEENPQGCSIM
ncbi:uncharacterized protein LOC112501818 [Cynara cardunculus var. scolymus]|uniref:uncharacterized protein LOC112501818 n=1 Tax=Cynara cardunculus var. scolymus TaxID=59895 RepID=UPI000D623DC4|nr:uncharacterized protein LOC112501818 [Cynara cardunculus var. scolymus]